MALLTAVFIQSVIHFIFTKVQCVLNEAVMYFIGILLDLIVDFSTNLEPIYFFYLEIVVT